MTKPRQLSPMFRQYRSIKADHPDAILLFRMGDFYEMFFDDAKDASRLLELTLTARGKGTDNVVPMCGFPHHQLDPYAARLVRAGRRVAVCDQVENPKSAKGLVKREVVRVVTPGTVLDPQQLDAREPSWAAAVASASGAVGAAFLDASTGEFLTWESPGPDGWDRLEERISAFRPKEVVHALDLAWPERLSAAFTASTLTTPIDPYGFGVEAATTLLRDHFGVASLDGFGLRDRPAATAAAGALLQYLQDTLRAGLDHVDRLTYHDPSDAVLLDAATRRNLEIDRTIREARRHGSLLHAIDATRTAAGARLLRARLLAPRIDAADIRRRLDAVAELAGHPDRRDRIRTALDGVHDVERVVGRAAAGSANPRELLALRSSLERLPDLLSALQGAAAAELRDIADHHDPCADVRERLAAAIADDPPAGLRDGGVIRDGFHDELDELRSIRTDGRSYIASLEARERETTGIASLKVRFNKVFGYFIEVSKPNLPAVPEDYVRKQTIANGERFVTPELKEYENKVLHAQERIEALEVELYAAVRREVAAEASRLKSAARDAAVLDVLAGLAETAVRRDYCRPSVDDGEAIEIIGGRHPVVEQVLVDGRFVPNDTALDCNGPAISILTGPNMGGKSTYLRQVAQIVLLAQAGSFVPAESARIGVVDRIFCRVGASDSLAEGHSTFMVEMSETANILHHATPRSLVLLDEIGRGTATFDGLSIAWAVVEHLHRGDGPMARTLFATHYHELTELAVQLPGVVNHRMAVRERGDGVVFTHRVEAGPADRSYGIHVARLAGIPDPVVTRAGEILRNLEDDAYGRDGLPRLARSQDPSLIPDTVQGTLFPTAGGGAAADEDPAVAEVLAELREQDPAGMSPLEALQRIFEWRRRLTGDDERAPR